MHLSHLLWCRQTRPTVMTDPILWPVCSLINTSSPPASLRLHNEGNKTRIKKTGYLYMSAQSTLSLFWCFHSRSYSSQISLLFIYISQQPVFFNKMLHYTDSAKEKKQNNYTDDKEKETYYIQFSWSSVFVAACMCNCFCLHPLFSLCLTFQLCRSKLHINHVSPSLTKVKLFKELSINT